MLSLIGRQSLHPLKSLLIQLGSAILRPIWRFLARSYPKINQQIHNGRQQVGAFIAA